LFVFNIQLDSKAILETLQFLGQERQGPFILSKTINQLAVRVRDALRTDIKNSLHLRHTNWVLNQVKIKPGTYSTKTRLKVKIDLSEAASFISDFELGNQHLPIAGHSYFCIPNQEVFRNAVIMPGNPLSIKNLQLQESKFGLRGLNGSFMLNTKNTGTPVIMQRVGPGAKGKNKRGLGTDGIRRLYTLVHASKRPSKIHWRDTANMTVEHEQYGIWTQVIKEALANPKK